MFATLKTTIPGNLADWHFEFIFQLGANILLFVCANILGTIDFSIADRKQRRSVLETRQSLEVKISLESENLKQVRFFLYLDPTYMSLLFLAFSLTRELFLFFQRRLLHSVLPKHVAAEMVKGIDATGAFSKEGEFKKLIVKRHEACRWRISLTSFAPST